MSLFTQDQISTSPGSMHQLFVKPLIVFLTLLLALAPLQGAWAGFDSASGHGVGAHQISIEQGDNRGAAFDHMANDSELCKSDGCPSGSSCTSSNCVSCALMVLSFSSHIPSSERASYMQRTGWGFKNRSISSLYRPPRV